MYLAEGRNISGVFISKQQGEYLAGLAADGPVYLNISVGPSHARPYNINRTSVLFVSISFIVLMMISLAWLVFYYVQRFRYIHAKDRLSRRLCSAARKALSKIPTKTIKSDDKEVQGDGECCAVCIEPYRNSDVLRILPCRHEFHKSCIDPWLLEHRTCPMCKMDILKHYGFVFTGSQESILHMEIEEVVGLSNATSPDPENVHPSSVSPRTQTQEADQQPPSTASAEEDGVSSRSSSPEEMRPTTSTGHCTAANANFTNTDSTGVASVSDPTLQHVVCSSCGSDLVARCTAVCDASSSPKDDITTSCSSTEKECSIPLSVDSDISNSSADNKPNCSKTPAPSTCKNMSHTK